jgi:hypothetical protein
MTQEIKPIFIHFDKNSLPSKIFSEFLNENPNETMKVKKILEKFEKNGFLLTLICFSLPAIIPLPPGFNFIVALPLLMLSFQMMLGYDKVILPKFLSEIEFKNSTIIKISKTAIPIFKKIEYFLKPRFNIIHTILPNRLIAMIAFICSISIMNPLPFTHSLPAFAIITMSIGLLNKDGIVTIFGVFTACCGIIFSVLSIGTIWFLIKTFLLTGK